MKDLDLLVTLWPTFSHYKDFAQDKRIVGVRLNSAMMHSYELDDDLKIPQKYIGFMDHYFDIKGKQLRIEDVTTDKDHLELTLNHNISVKTPTPVLFKAAEDGCLLEKVVDGNKLIFDGGPEYMVYPGESLHIRDPSLEVNGELFTQQEKEKIEKAKKAGFNKWFLSYTEKQADIDEFRDYVGKDATIIAKIENKKGLNFVANEYKKQKNLYLMAACGDLYVEVDKPHQIMDALKLIIEKDKESYTGSRMLLSLVNRDIPSFADLGQLGWFYEIGYRKMMLCDELCLKGELLSKAINVFDAFRDVYAKEKRTFLQKIKYSLRK